MANKIPYRSCVVTREKHAKKDLIRVVRMPDGTVLIDNEKGKTNGKGAYLKKDKAVVERAKKTKILDRVLEVEVPDNIYEDLIASLKEE